MSFFHDYLGYWVVFLPGPTVVVLLILALVGFLGSVKNSCQEAAKIGGALLLAPLFLAMFR